MPANTSVAISELDFGTIKTALRNYLAAQDTFVDYDFEGSALSTILNVMAYNTHYNAFYLNMVANEMFLDSAVKRSSVVSHAKLLNYTPKSNRAPKATINITFNSSGQSSITIPKYTEFYSKTVLDGKNYSFVILDDVTGTKSGSNITINNIEIVQGQKLSANFPVNLLSNPSQVFKIPSKDVDTSTLRVLVFQNNQSTSYELFSLCEASNILELTETSRSYFLQESFDGYYEIYFGDGILGKKLSTGNIVSIDYVATKGDAANGAEKFTLMEDLGDYSFASVTTVSKASGGQLKESIDSIKFSAPKQYSSKARAVTKEDYINLISINTNIIPIEAVSVWGGEEETPPVLGKIFISIKPTGAYLLTETQKTKFYEEVIRPISVMTVKPEIVDPDYTYLKIDTELLFNTSRSIVSKEILKTTALESIQTFCKNNLNKFNSTFILPDLILDLKNLEESVVSADANLKLSKKFLPLLKTENTIQLNFKTPVKKDYISGTIFSSKFSMKYSDTSKVVDNVFLEASPILLHSIEYITVKQAGSGFTSTPIIDIIGDGIDATATAEVVNGKIKSITVTNPGSGYTSAIVRILGGGGKNASAYATLTGNIVPLRAVVFENSIKKIVADDVGTLNFSKGIVNLINFNVYDVEDPYGYFEVSIIPDSRIIKSTGNNLLSLDSLDSSAISITVKNYV